MDSSTQAITPLRQRMIEDMRMRKLADKTQSHYIRAVRQFAGFLGRSPDTASVEDLRRYQLHLVDRGISPISLNAAITGLKFFLEVTLDHGELIAKMQPVRVPRTLPVVLSREEVARLIAAAGKWLRSCAGRSERNGTRKWSIVLLHYLSGDDLGLASSETPWCAATRAPSDRACKNEYDANSGGSRKHGCFVRMAPEDRLGALCGCLCRE